MLRTIAIMANLLFVLPLGLFVVCVALYAGVTSASAIGLFIFGVALATAAVLINPPSTRAVLRGVTISTTIANLGLLVVGVLSIVQMIRAEDGLLGVNFFVPTVLAPPLSVAAVGRIRPGSKPPFCAECGYDLIGLKSSSCPECGHRGVSSAESSR